MYRDIFTGAKLVFSLYLVAMATKGIFYIYLKYPTSILSYGIDNFGSILSTNGIFQHQKFRLFRRYFSIPKSYLTKLKVHVISKPTKHYNNTLK